jgi:hypothetical protein
MLGKLYQLTWQGRSGVWGLFLLETPVQSYNYGQIAQYMHLYLLAQLALRLQSDEA